MWFLPLNHEGQDVDELLVWSKLTIPVLLCSISPELLLQSKCRALTAVSGPAVFACSMWESRLQPIFCNWAIKATESIPQYLLKVLARKEIKFMFPLTEKTTFCNLSDPLQRVFLNFTSNIINSNKTIFLFQMNSPLLYYLLVSFFSQLHQTQVTGATEWLRKETVKNKLPRMRNYVFCQPSEKLKVHLGVMLTRKH